MVLDTNKRQPTLADRFMWSDPKTSWVSDEVNNRVKARVREAQKFVLTTAASIRAAEVIRDMPELIAKNQQFARAPYDVTWIEFDFEAFYQTINKNDVDPTADKRIGFLIDHDHAYVIGGSDDPKLDPVLTPARYDLHTAWSVEDQLDLCAKISTSRMQLDTIAWGTSYNILDTDTQRALREHNAIRLLPTNIKVPSKLLAGIFQETVADLRNIIAMLLLLNRPSLTKYVAATGNHRGFHRGKQRQYWGNTTVDIPLDPRPTIRLLGTSEGEEVARRRHEVRGAWHHDAEAHAYAAIGCVHEWEKANDFGNAKTANPDRYRCRVCGGKRWWHPAHERGSDAVGRIQKNYAVTHK